MADKKSPINDQPLRQAGQSVREHLNDVCYDKIMSYAFIAMILWILAFIEWSRQWTNAAPNPLLYTVFALGISVYAYFRIRKEMKVARNYKQGMIGERAVGEFLDRLRANGYRVFHDIPGDNWNIDHVIICDRGVFTIETKTISKPSIGEARIEFDGERVKIDGGKRRNKSIVQAKCQARQIRLLLKENTGFDFPVQPVVVYPGWYVETLPDAKSSAVWVLNPKALHKWIDNESVQLPVDRIKVGANAISKYVRQSTR